MTTRPAKIISVDASTTSLAFALFVFGKIEYVGKINFEGKDIYERCIDASKKLKSFFNSDISTMYCVTC